MDEVKVFRDPLYGYVKVEEELIWNLIQCKEFQRLRRIRQLGGVYIVYHTAEHTRFSHSLGVYEVTRRIIFEVDEIRTTLTKEERLITLCAALLHDLGHGPYSHAFEMVFDTVHEDYSVAIILGDTQINKILKSYNKSFPNKVAKVIQKKCYKQNCVNNKCNHNIMNTIVSSQLDADRLDYLQRDAYFSGATYGEIDLERILRSFLVIDKKIAFKYTSMHAIEDYLVSRYHMYWQVYFHPVGISHDILFINLFKRVKHLLQSSYQFKNEISIIKKLLTNNINVNEYLELDESWILYKIKEWRNENDTILVDLCQRFLNRYLYKYITCKNKETLGLKYQKLNKLFKKYDVDTRYYLYSDTLIKEAYQYYNDEVVGITPILLVMDGELVEITELSHIVKGIKKVGAKEDYKIYYAQEFIDNFNDDDKDYFYDLINE